MRPEDVLELVEKLITDSMKEEGFVTAVAAVEVAERMRAEYPKELRVWLDLQAIDLVRVHIGRRIRAAKTAWPAAQFAEAVAAGDTSKFVWDAWFKAGVEIKKLHLMTGPECGIAAKAYESRAASNKMRGAFLRAMEKRVGRKKVEEVMSKDQVQRLWDSIT